VALHFMPDFLTCKDLACNSGHRSHRSRFLCPSARHSLAWTSVAREVNHLLFEKRGCIRKPSCRALDQYEFVCIVPTLGVPRNCGGQAAFPRDEYRLAYQDLFSSPDAQLDELPPSVSALR
jgi:hypothetical protein